VLRALLASVLTMLVLAVGSARAGTYVIGDCPAAFNQSGSAGPWTFIGGDQSSVTVATKLECSGGPGDWIGFGTNDIPGFTGFRMTTSGTNLTVVSAKLWWRAYGSFSDNGRTDFPHSYGQIVDGQGNGDSQFTTGTVWDTTSKPLVVNFPAADSATTVEIGENCIPFNNLLSCPMGNSGPQYGGVALAVQIFGVELTLQDNLPPSAEVVGGSLDGPGPVTGPAQLAFIATDQNAGILNAELLVDGQPVATHNYSASCTYTQLQACPGSISDQFTWNSGSVAPGEHQVALRVTDAAGNTTLSSPHEVTVLAPIGPNGTPCAGPTISLSVAGRTPPAKIRYGQRPTINGMLHCGVTPIPGATVDVGAADAGTEPSLADPTAAVKTASDGSFSYRLAPGASRTLTFSYTAYSDDATPTASTLLPIAVIPKISLRITPRHTHNNSTITWRGEVSGGPYPPGGVGLQVQVREDRRWVTFDDLVTRGGRFSYRYTFHRTTQPTTYTFRVSLPYGGSVGYPYRWAASRKIAIHVA
jgi:hypothetical protein